MGVNKYAVQAEEDAQQRLRDKETARIAEQATAVVEAWEELFAKETFVFLWPSIGAAIAAGKPWLTFFCPGCQVRGAVDLRAIAKTRRFHPGASIEALVPAISCQRCRPLAPHARLTGLSATKPHVTFWKNADQA